MGVSYIVTRSRVHFAACIDPVVFFLLLSAVALRDLQLPKKLIIQMQKMCLDAATLLLGTPLRKELLRFIHLKNGREF